MRPFCLSHLMASAWSPWVSSRAFLHYPMGALVYYLSFLSASMETLKVEKSLFVMNLLINMRLVSVKCKDEIIFNLGYFTKTWC